MKEGHAWVGVWLHPACFADPLTDDVQAVRKRVDSGEFLAFETTGIAQHPSFRPSLRLALEQGAAHLREDDTFRYAIDVHRARDLQIKPLPSRAGAATPGEPMPPRRPPPSNPRPSCRRWIRSSSSAWSRPTTRPKVAWPSGNRACWT